VKRCIERNSSEDWKEKYGAVDDLRAVNKFCKDFPSFVEIAMPMIVEGIENLRSNVSKNALVLAKELYKNEHHEDDLRL
jgi:hypothetical protein